jgi:hypothetical protein
MAPALTATPWVQLLDILARHQKNDTAALLAWVLRDVIKETDDPAVARVLDRYASRMLESP